MNFGSWLVWGFGATVVLTALLAGSQSLRFTRMNIPYMLGTMITPQRDRAKIYGVVMHLINGWIFSFIYVGAFHYWGGPSGWKGCVIGFVHGAFVLVAGLPVLPGMHPRMASEHHGPTVVKQLEPPGFLGLNYGIQTPISIMVSHMIFGLILGGFYEP